MYVRLPRMVKKHVCGIISGSHVRKGLKNLSIIISTRTWLLKHLFYFNWRRDVKKLGVYLINNIKDMEDILKIYILHSEQKDKRIWMYIRNGKLITRLTF